MTCCSDWKIGWGGCTRDLRLGLEREHEAQAFGQGLTFLHLENMPVTQALIEIILRGTGAYWRGRSNAARVVLNRNVVCLPSLPVSFDRFTILHLSDLHADMSQRALARAAARRPRIRPAFSPDYGDYRPTLELIAQLRASLHGAVYGVLGNHDSIKMVPDLEASGIVVLLNESSPLDGARMRSASRRSTTRISTVRTTSRKRRRRFQGAAFQSFCPTRQRSIAKRLTPGST
jgi:hypothetical protein